MAIDYAELGVEPGKIIAEKYRLVRLIGRGGMGSVWRCDHLELMSPVALKVIKPGLAKNKNSLARFMREAKAAARLRSPHVVQILEYGSEGAIAYIAMELMEGESLYGRLRRDGILSAALTARVLTHVGRAMAKAHDTGITHRDLKPDNIFLVTNDDEIMGKVLDFGVAKSAAWSLDATGESPETQTGTLLGTPYYMSPEQATGSRNVDHRSDLWAMGVMAFECLLGIRPYQSNALGDLVLKICAEPQPVPSTHGSVPQGFDEWFARANHRTVDQRFQSAKDMTKALRGVLLDQGHGVTGSLDADPVTTRLGASNLGPADPGPVEGPLAGPETLQEPSSEDESTSNPGLLTVTQDSSTGLPRVATPFEQANQSDATATPSEPSGPRIAATPFDRSDDAPADSGPTAMPPLHGSRELQTLDPLAATSVPRRKTWLMGSLAAVVLAASVAFITTKVTSSDPPQPDADPSAEPANPAGLTSAAPAQSTPSAPIESPSSAAAEDLPTAVPTVEADGGPPPASPTPYRPPRPPRPPKAKPPDGPVDPLGI